MLEVTELIKGIETVCRDQEDSTKRVALMTMNVLIKLYDFIETHVAANPLSLEEGVYEMTACVACFFVFAN